MSDEIGNLGGETSQKSVQGTAQKSVQGTAIFLLTTYRKMRVERNE